MSTTNRAAGAHLTRVIRKRGVKPWLGQPVRELDQGALPEISSTVRTIPSNPSRAPATAILTPPFIRQGSFGGSSQSPGHRTWGVQGMRRIRRTTRRREAVLKGRGSLGWRPSDLPRVPPRWTRDAFRHRSPRTGEGERVRATGDPQRSEGEDSRSRGPRVLRGYLDSQSNVTYRWRACCRSGDGSSSWVLPPRS